MSAASRRQQLGQRDGSAGAVNGPGKTLPRQPGNQPAVIDVHVRQQQRVDLAAADRTAFPVAVEEFPLLEHAAVDQHLAAIRFQTIPRTGDLPIGPEKVELHKRSSLISKTLIVNRVGASKSAAIGPARNIECGTRSVVLKGGENKVGETGVPRDKARPGVDAGWGRRASSGMTSTLSMEPTKCKRGRNTQFPLLALQVLHATACVGSVGTVNNPGECLIGACLVPPLPPKGQPQTSPGQSGAATAASAAWVTRTYHRQALTGRNKRRVVLDSISCPASPYSFVCRRREGLTRGRGCSALSGLALCLVRLPRARDAGAMPIRSALGYVAAAPSGRIGMRVAGHQQLRLVLRRPPAPAARRLECRACKSFSLTLTAR